MAAPALLGLLLAFGTPGLPADGGAGEGPAPAPTESAPAYQPGRRFVVLPDTSKAHPARTDTTNAIRPTPAALPPDAASTDEAEAPVTRKSALYVATAMAVLTLITLLLYNVRSR